MRADDGLWTDEASGPNCTYWRYKISLLKAWRSAQVCEQLLAASANHKIVKLDKVLWQQSGAPPHYGDNVSPYLREEFSQWIGCRCTAYWSPWSDLTLCDYSL